MKTAASTRLPDFLIIGAQKCGTSSLHRYLAQHPAIERARVKEVHYFDGGRSDGEDVYALGPDWYRTHFPDRPSGKLTFESTPRYLFHPACADRIHALLPEVKLIVLLRDPVERAISHYFHNLRMGREPLGMGEALEAEAERTAIKNRAEPMLIKSSQYAYRGRGLYADQLRRYFARFDRDRIFIWQSERFFADPAFTVSRVLNFIGLGAAPKLLNLTPRNVGANKAPVDPTVAGRLRATFRDANEDLFDLLGRRFAWD